MPRWLVREMGRCKMNGLVVVSVQVSGLCVQEFEAIAWIAALVNG